MAVDIITSSTTWSRSTDGSNITVECIGGGGGGSGSAGFFNQNGGGGGEYVSSSVAYTSGASISVVIGAAGVGNFGDGTDGGDTTFNGTTVVAKGGTRGGAQGAGGTGGTGATKFNGGSGAGGQGGGGGAAGPNGVGGNGVVGGSGGMGGQGDNGFGGVGANPDLGTQAGDGTEWGTSPNYGSGGGGGGNHSGLNAGNYGGGGGGSNNIGTNGTAGIMRITYTPFVAPTIKGGTLLLLGIA